MKGFPGASATAALLACLLCGVVIGCHVSSPSAETATRTNPSFPISIADARRRLENDSNRQFKLDRPLVICGGFLDVGIGPWLMEQKLSGHFKGTILLRSFATCGSLQSCRERLVRRIDETLGVVDDSTTYEVDVIGQSMGGLIAVYAALDDPTLGKRVKIRRLYTICSPLQGAKLAALTSFNVFRYQRDLRQGSALYSRLAGTPIDYELVSYARLNDKKVGEEYCGLPPNPVWWVDTPANEDAHDRADCDPRILLDIVLRLRNETPVTTSPPVPLPTTKPGERIKP